MAFRILQAVGAAAASGTATAIVKDVYQGRRREVIIAVIQSMIVLSPAVAPVIGALILRFTSWRGTFVAQAILGVVVLAGAVAFRETIGARLTGNPLASLKRLGVVLSEPDLCLPALQLLAARHGGDGFHRLLFVHLRGDVRRVQPGLQLLLRRCSRSGWRWEPQLYVWLSRRFSRNTILMGCFGASAVSGILMLLVGPLGPWPFILALLPMPVAFSCMRPPAVYLMLAQHEGDAGSVSALMSSTFMVMASIGMIVVSLNLWGRVELVGALTLGLAVLSGVMWALRPRGGST